MSIYASISLLLHICRSPCNCCSFIFCLLICLFYQEPEAEAIVPTPTPAVVPFSGDEPPLIGSSLLVSLSYWKPSEKLTVVVMKAKNLSLIDKSKKPGEWQHN